MRSVGTVVRGIRTPIIKENDDVATIVVDSVMEAAKEEGFKFHDQDIVGVTEAVVAIANGNYASVDAVAKDIKNKFPEGEIGVIFPILSRNRFSMVLKGIARGSKKITMMLSFPSDEVGNALFEEKYLEKFGIDKFSEVLTEKQYNDYFGNLVHPFTGVNYVNFYRDLINGENCEVEFIFSNQAITILDYQKNVLTCDIHTRAKTKMLLEEHGVSKVYGLDDILTTSIDGSGYNPTYGLLGSNKSTEERLKLFPRNGEEVVTAIQKSFKEKTNCNIEVLVYGDGAFKDPVGKIWELADPVVSPAYTSGLEGTPNELKLKYISDNEFANLHGDELKSAVCTKIAEKDVDLKGSMISQGTTPRKYTDLIGSLCDLTSGSGDKGTPVVFIQGYFDNLASE